MGSAGTGKSYIAIAVGLKMLELKLVHKMIISRPPLETGQSLGFLPGDVNAKMEMFLIPIYNILAELVGKERRDKYIADGAIEILPIGHMRGTSWGARDGVYVCVDEVQNMDFIQHKLVLTRIGSHPNSRVVLCGDQRQSDLRNGKDTLSLIHSIIKPSKYVGSTIFNRNDVVRSEAVKDILGLIEDYEDKQVR